jgi:excisionase family DNA binding protein
MPTQNLPGEPPVKPGLGVEDSYLPLKALASYAGLSVRTLRGCLDHPARPLPHYRIGGRILVKRSEFDHWAEQFKVQAQPQGVDSLVDDVLAALR